MNKINEISHNEQQLPPRVVEALYQLAEKYDNKGVRLFIFGSFARSEAWQTSDLDLGIEWTGKRSAKIYSDLCRDIRGLPTIRKIDLVDMEQVDETFKQKVMDEAVFLLQGEKVK